MVIVFIDVIKTNKKKEKMKGYNQPLLSNEEVSNNPTDDYDA